MIFIPQAFIKKEKLLKLRVFIALILANA